MDGIALELWNKKLLQCRYKRQLEFKACAELAHSSRAYSVEPLPFVLFQAAAENLDILILYWKETFQGSWQRQKGVAPSLAADRAQAAIQVILTTEQKQIEHEVESLGSRRGLGWKPEDFLDGKSLLDKKIALLRASCLEQVTDLKIVRQEELTQGENSRKAHRRELWYTRALLGVLVLASALGGVWLGAYLYTQRSVTDAKRSVENKEFVAERMQLLMAGQRRMQDQLSELHRSNRKIAFWTEKTPAQIDKEMTETQENLTHQIQDIREETARRSARVDNEYARSGREGGADLEIRKGGLLKLQSKLIEAAEQKAQKKLDDLEEQKRNIMR